MLRSRYTKTIKKPYSKALIRLEFVTELVSFLVKKLTVNGIIGKTQGVSKASKPPKIPREKIRQREFDVMDI